MKIIDILDEDDLYRRVQSFWIKDDGKPSSAAFQNTSGTDDMSVDLGRLTTPELTASVQEGCGVASFSAELARINKQKVLHIPIPENCSHSSVIGKKTNSIKKKLARGSKIIYLPPEND